MQLKRLVLPAPLGPMTAVSLPALDLEGHVVERGHAAEADRDVVDHHQGVAHFSHRARRP